MIKIVVEGKRVSMEGITRMKKGLLPGLLVMLFLAGGCASQRDVIALNDRLIDLERGSMELRQRGEMLQRENQTLRSRLEEYSLTREKTDSQLQDRSAGLHATLESFQEQIRDLNGRTEELNHRMDQMQITVESLQTRSASRGSFTPGSEPMPGYGPVPAGGQESTSPEYSGSAYGGTYGASGTPEGDYQPATSPAGASSPTFSSDGRYGSAEDIYVAAKRAFDANNHEQAQKGFQTLLELYPRSPHADNAHFWIGEIFYRQRRYEEAILEYQTVIEQYPDGNKVRASLLKQGFSFMNIGDTTNARLILEDLIRRHPGSREALMAREKLAGL